MAGIHGRYGRWTAPGGPPGGAEGGAEGEWPAAIATATRTAAQAESEDANSTLRDMVAGGGLEPPTRGL